VLAAPYRIAAVTVRENPHDALISREHDHGRGFEGLARGARLGTSSQRRRCEALRIRPDLEVLPLRGNVDTRLRLLAAGDFDAIILAMAGLTRLGYTDAPGASELDEHDFVPAAGQGALAIETLAATRLGSAELDEAISRINDPQAAAEVTAERAFLAAIGASCVSPVGVKGSLDGGVLALHALIFSLDGRQHLAGESRQPSTIDPAALGAALAANMLARGAREMLAE
jgi:hydroxymethylbilane synthase